MSDPSSSRTRPRGRARLCFVGSVLMASGAAGAALPGVAAAAGEPVMGLDHVRSGMACSVRSVLHGTAITRFDATMVDVVSGSVTGEGPRILVRVSGPAIDATGVGPGFSGSPISCPDVDGVEKIVGAISEGAGDTTNRLVLATPIQAILGEPVTPPSHASSAPLARVRPLAGPLSISGAPAWLAQALQAGARRAGRTLLTAPAAPLEAFAPVDLQPGSAMAASLATGDLSLGAIGTVTYRDGSRVWAFGHPLDDVGARTLLLQDAYVYDIVTIPGFFEGSYKLSAPGHVLGTLSDDTPQAVVGTLAHRPGTVPLTVVARDGDRGTRTVLHEQVADESALGDPMGPSPMRVIVAPATSLAADGALDGGPARQTARLCVRVALRGRSTRLGFCTREVSAGGMPYTLSADVDQALALVDQNTFARLPLRAVQVRMTIHRGLDEAYLLRARGPREARPGTRVVLRATARRFRGPRLRVSVPVRIPRDAAPGRRTIVLSGSSPAATSDVDMFAALFGGAMSEDEGQHPAGSMAELVRRMKALGGYDGLVARVGGRHARAQRVLRSPAVRITGRVRVQIRITRPH